MALKMTAIATMTGGSDGGADASTSSSHPAPSDASSAGAFQSCDPLTVGPSKPVELF